MDVSSSQRTAVTHKSKHMVAWLLKNEFVSSTDSRISHYRKAGSTLNVSDIGLRKRELQTRLRDLIRRRHSMQQKDLELSFRRENLRRKANELFVDDEVSVSPAKKPRMGVSSLTPVKKHLTKTSTTQTSSSLLTRGVTSQEVLFYTRNGVRCTWC
ncbi:uncharacterized protein LOC121374289 [Gigantopelta aegis]|uniref:uncharacterized protein LOC121374289 n=1 Tax=Gigantopelta aegis TaxID=1735272 RepID=UPI001B889E1E|nr:uncharacterized protein LOC121374289 [Gigantopelta aegis]